MDDRALFGQICRETLTARYEAELKACKGKVKCSSQHYKRVSEILGIEAKPHGITSRRVIALIVAAALLLLTACAAYIYREELRGLFVEKTNDRDKIYATDEPPKNDALIQEVYTLTYVPEGFELIRKEKDASIVSYEWVNNEGKYILYTQLNQNTPLIIDKGRYYVIKVSEYENEIYYSFNENLYVYVWNDGKYNNRISSQIELSEFEFLKIIEGIVST